MNKWVDSRLTKPNCNRFNKYITIVDLAGIPMLMLTEWIPVNNYTDGDWGNSEGTNGNKHGKEPVLYWMEWPNKPQLIEEE